MKVTSAVAFCVLFLGRKLNSWRHENKVFKLIFLKKVQLLHNHCFSKLYSNPIYTEFIFTNRSTRASKLLAKLNKDNDEFYPSADI